MKNKYLMILATSLLIVGFAGCDKEKSALSTKKEELHRPSSIYEYSDNPYDSIGVIHNAICQYVDEQFKEYGFALTNGENDTIVSYESFYQNPPLHDYRVQIKTILDYIEEYLIDNDLINHSGELKSFCQQNDLIDEEMPIDIVYDINDFRSSLQNHIGVTSLSFQNQLTNLVFGTDNLEDRIIAAKNIESGLLSIQDASLSKKELMLLSVYRHSTDLWYSHSGNDIDMLPPWVGSDLTGLYSIFWFGATLPNPLGAGIIIGYTVLCSAVAAYEFSR